MTASIDHIPTAIVCIVEHHYGKCPQCGRLRYLIGHVSLADGDGGPWNEESPLELNHRQPEPFDECRCRERRDDGEIPFCE